jgi:hypothetical protein
MSLIIFFEKTLFVLVFLVCSFYCAAQKEGDLSIGLSLDYGLGKDLNNYASTFHFYYSPSNNIRLSPSFSYYFEKDDIRMTIFNLNFHYLFPNLAARIFPAMKNQGIYLYPLAGFCVANVSKLEVICRSCSETFVSRSKYIPHFGFDFGVGADYELSKVLPEFENMNANFEFGYQTLDHFERPVFVFGLSYKF